MTRLLLFNVFITSTGNRTSSKITKLDDDNNSFKVRKTRISWEELPQFQKSKLLMTRRMLCR